MESDGLFCIIFPYDRNIARKKKKGMIHKLEVLINIRSNGRAWNDYSKILQDTSHLNSHNIQLWIILLQFKLAICRRCSESGNSSIANATKRKSTFHEIPW